VHENELQILNFIFMMKKLAKVAKMAPGHGKIALDFGANARCEAPDGPSLRFRGNPVY
jgi:hypothetical protein